MGEWSFFQIEPHTIGDDWAVGDSAQQLRAPDVKMSNFGALRFGTRRTDDYTNINGGFKAQGILEGADAFGIHDLRGAGQYEGEKNMNPYVWGSTVKKVRDEQFTRMGMSMGGNDVLMSRDTPNAQIDPPKFDESDNEESLGSWVAGKNYPTEGWRSFGGKYDYERAYDGTLR
jgi:hypothetical protein